MLASKITIFDDAIDTGKPHRLITVAEVRAIFGDVSDMTIWRWLKDADLNFPKPIYVQRRRFWREADLIEWISHQPREIKD